jgi:hypothetical protein
VIDQIIRSAQVYFEQHPEAGPIIIATDDGSMKVRCRALGLRVVGIPETERLPVPQDDLQKKVRKLEAELATERNRRPDFALSVTLHSPIADESGWSGLYSSETLRVVDVAHALEEIRTAKPKLETGSPHHFDFRLSLLGADQIKSYNEELDRYSALCEQYHTNLNEWVGSRGTFFSFDLNLANQGQALANHVQLEMIFPPFVYLLDAETIDNNHDPMPLPPRVPKEPDPYRGLFPSAFIPVPGPSIAEQLAAEPHKPRIELFNDENGSRLTCRLGKLLHGVEPIRLGIVTLWFPTGEEPKTFGATYSLRAAELPAVVEGQVVFPVKDDQQDED